MGSECQTNAVVDIVRKLSSVLPLFFARPMVNGYYHAVATLHIVTNSEYTWGSGTTNMQRCLEVGRSGVMIGNRCCLFTYLFHKSFPPYTG